MSKSKIHEKNVLPDGEWIVARGKKNTDELFVQARKNGRRLCRMWDGIEGRDATARLFAASKMLLEAGEALYEAFVAGRIALDPDETEAIVQWTEAVEKAKAGPTP